MMKKIAVIANQKKAHGVELAQKVDQWLIQRGIKTQILNLVASTLQEMEPDTDAIIVLGGDGSLLRTARFVDTWGIPILGVNLGHLGFLTEVEQVDLFTHLGWLLEGKFEIEERMMLESQVIREGKVLDQARALNDVVITKGPLARIITLDAYIDQQYFSTFRGDGLIIATPTGSTAYSLSAGGPIVAPTVEVMLLTPICPHTFYSRPLVISADQRVRIVLKPRFDEVAVTLDGQYGIPLQANDAVEIFRSTFSTRLIRLGKQNFFDTMRNKLTYDEKKR